jgi:hypothetical protein
MRVLSHTHRCVFRLSVSFISEKKDAQVLNKKQSFYEAEARVSGRQLTKKQELLKSRMKAAELKLKSEQI